MRCRVQWEQRSGVLVLGRDEVSEVAGWWLVPLSRSQWKRGGELCLQCGACACVHACACVRVRACVRVAAGAHLCVQKYLL